MFQGHRDRAAAVAQDVAENQWNQRVAMFQSLISVVNGTRALETNGLMLKSGELLLGQVQNAGLIEFRRDAGHWQGASQGFSIPIGSIKGRSVRYRIGESHGHFIQGDSHPSAVDHGTMSITDRRIVYQGAAKSTECLFTKLLGVQQSSGVVTISVSNRQKPTVLHFGSSLDDWVADRISIATSLYQGDRDQVLTQLNTQLNDLLADKPVP